MNLKEKISNDLREAMKSHDELRTSTLRMISSAILYLERGISADYQATDEDVLKVLNKQLKQREESIEMFKKGGREELAQKEAGEMEIIKQYLPEQLGEEEVREIVEETIRETGASSMADMGKVMGSLSQKIQGKASGILIARIAREKLQG